MAYSLAFSLRQMKMSKTNSKTEMHKIQLFFLRYLKFAWSAFSMVWSRFQSPCNNVSITIFNLIQIGFSQPQMQCTRAMREHTTYIQICKTFSITSESLLPIASSTFTDRYTFFFQQIYNHLFRICSNVFIRPVIKED